MNNISEFFLNNFSDCVWLVVILFAMIPTLESKIAIPLALNKSIWGAHALSPISALLLAFIGSIIPCYLVILFVRGIRKKTTFFLHSKFLQKYAIKGAQIERKNNFHKYMSLAAFVSVPIPLTGVWSGSLISGFSNLNIHFSFVSISIGAFVSAGAITLLCCLFDNSISSIFILSLIIIITYLLFDLILSYIKPRKKSGV